MQLPREFIKLIQSSVDTKNILTEAADCWPYGYDNSRQQVMPDIVVFATTTTQVQQIIQHCKTHNIPVVTRGRGTGTTGATVPVKGGLVLSLERMDRILRIDPANRYLVAEPGVTNKAIQDAAHEHGFFWPPDPTSSAFCTLGGNLAYNSAGPHAVKYGTPRDNTLGLKAITGNADLIKTGVCTTKGVVGYDLTRLLIGSEGTLAVITEATLKLTPLPETRKIMQLVYRDIDSAAHAVSSIMAQPVTPSSLELMDQHAIDMIRDDTNLDLPENITLLMVEVDGTHASIDHAIQAVQHAANNHGCLQTRLANSPEEEQSLWQLRKALSPALRKIAPKKINEDVVVPVSNIPSLLNGLQALSKEYNIPIVNFGHAGNGNIHVNLLTDVDTTETEQRATQCLEKVFDLVLSLDGTLSGEHGIGLVKRNFIAREIDPVTLQLMRNIKKQFDPEGIMNPGKMIPGM